MSMTLERDASDVRAFQAFIHALTAGGSMDVGKALIAAAEEFAAVDEPPITDGDRATVVDDFMWSQRAQGFSECTVRNRLSIIRGLERIAGTSCLDVDTATVVAYIGRPGIKASSRRINLVALQTFFQFAVARHLRRDDPTEGIPMVRVPKGRPRPFTPAQIDAMLESGAYRRTRAMILIGYYQGFRVSQIARVHGHDIDAAGRTIRTTSKGSKERRLPLHPVIAELAQSMPVDGWWFPARGDGREGPINSSSVTNLITLAKKRAGIHDPKLTPHSLRHSFATHMVDKGVDIRVIQELLLHESLGTTVIYAGVSERVAREGIETLHGVSIPQQSNRGRAVT